jgi:cell division cycle 14
MTPPLNNRTSKHIKHIGTRPKNDQDNHCRELLCHLVKDVGCFYEICPEKLYMVYLAKGERLDSFLELAGEDSPFIFWSSKDRPKLVYEAFNMDFGPFNLAVTHHFCSRIKVWLDTQPYRDPDKYIVVVLEDSDTEMKLNTTLLVAIAAMVLLNLTDEEVLQRLNFFMMYKGKPGEPSKQLVFREKKKFLDVSGNQSLMTLTLEDCIRAFYAALQYKFYDYYEFDHIEYLFYETVLSGDLNWIIPGKILAFAGPCDRPSYSKHSPNFYYNYFKDHNVTSIIRLNDPEYDSAGFTKLGFQHHDLIFPDGYPPTSSIAAKFIKIVDEAKGAVAVHCYAGIGRTGTLIAAYLMARYNFTTQMAVAWTRICRPGSVIGEQQDWLYTKFDYFSYTKGNNQSLKQSKARKIKATGALDNKISPTTTPTRKSANLATHGANISYTAAEKTYGQARALIMAKKQREMSSDKPRTRSNSASMKKESTDLDSSTSSNKDVQVKTRADVVLDLGKTVPLCLYLKDLLPLKGQRNPEFYRLKDNKYEWKVKFPKSDYVDFKHSYDIELGMMCDENEVENVARPPLLDFQYIEDTTSTPAKSKNDPLKPSNLKPTIYYQVS